MEDKTRKRHWWWGVLGWGCFGLVVAALLAFNAALIWVATGPRDLARMMPYLERSVNAPDAPYFIRFGEGKLLWDGWRNPLDIRLQRVDVYTREGKRFATFPEVSLGISLPHLLVGAVVPNAVTLRRPIISLFREPDGKLRFGSAVVEEVEGTGEDQATIELLSHFIKGDGSSVMARIRYINVVNAEVSVGDMTGILLRAKNVDINLARGWSGLTGRISARIPQEANEAGVVAVLEGEPGGEVEANLQLRRLKPSTLAPLLPDAALLNGITLDITGTARAVVTTEGALREAEFYLQGGAGEVRTEFFDKPIAVYRAVLEGSLDHAVPEEPMVVHVTRAIADLEGFQARAAAKIKLKEDGDAAIQIHAETENAPAGQFTNYWPPKLAPLSREWVEKNIRGGNITKASVRTDIKFGDLKAPALPEEAVDAQIHFENGEIGHMPDHAPVREASGVVRINGKSLEGRLDSGAYLEDTVLSRGRVWIADLVPDNPRIEVSFDATSSVRDIIKFMSLPPLEKSEHLGLDARSASGKATGTANLVFYYFVPLGPDGKPRDDLGVEFDIKAKLLDAGVNGFMDRFDISNAKGDMEINNQKIVFKGSAKVNGADVRQSEIRYSFTPDANGLDTYVAASAIVPVSALPKFGYPDVTVADGSIAAGVEVKQGTGKEFSAAELDLTAMSIDWVNGGLRKAAGEPAKLRLKAEKTAAGTDVNYLSLDGAGMKANGRALIGTDGKTLKELTLDSLTLGRNQLALTLGEVQGGWRIRANGPSADITSFMGDGDDFRFSTFPAVDLELNLGKLILGEKRELTQVKGHMLCTTVKCERANLSGMAGRGAFQFQIIPAKRRALKLQVEDAGAFLSALDVYENVRGGKLALNGEYRDDAPNRPLRATLWMRDFEVVNAPLLAKLLSLASLPSLLDTLGGKGIAFEKLKAPFELENDVITLDESKAYGSAMGISALGTITFPGQGMQLKGTVVPSYALNTVLGKVPIVGDIVTGGGEGVIGVRYTIEGKGENADVNVNPLSLLTPGFLRGFFDIFEGDGEKPKRR